MKNYLPIFFAIVLMSTAACQSISEKKDTDTPEIDLSTIQEPGLFFVDSSDLKRPAFAKLLVATRQLLSTQPAYARKITEGWHYAPGVPANGLRADWSQRPKPDTILELPHRIPQPNWPLWYEQKIALSEPMYLYANGDDGVQCYLNGILSEPVMGSYFLVEPAEDSVLVSLRVLNNAMSGGLRGVALIKSEDFEVFRNQRQAMLPVLQLLYHAHREPEGGLDHHMQQAEFALKNEDWPALEKLKGELKTLQLPYLPPMPDQAAPTTVFSFTAWGDSQGGWPVFDRIVQQMVNHPDDFSIGLGDLVAEGVDEDQWIAFTQCLQPLLADRPVFAVAGNHDYDGYYNDLNPRLYRQYVLNESEHPTYFSWTYGNAFFLALDPNETFPIGITGGQRAWMEAQMDRPEWAAADWRFVLLHQPPYSQGWPDYHGDDFIREIVDSLAESKQIDFVLSGHSHDYERLSKTYGIQQTHFFILGGAGGGLEPAASSTFPKMDTIIKQHHYARFELDGTNVRVSVFGADGQLLEGWIHEKINETSRGGLEQ